MSDNTPADATPQADDVFPLVSDLGQLLLDWSWEGTVGLETKIERVADAYDQDVVSVVTAETAVVKMGSNEALLKGLPGIPPLAALPGLKNLLIRIEKGGVAPDVARSELKQVADTGPIYPALLRIFGTMMLSFGFAVSIVGTWEACIVAFLTGIFSGFFLLQAEKGVGWALGAPFLASFFVSAAVVAAYQLDWVSEVPGVLMLSALFVFIPGDSITMQAVELVDGRWSAAVSRLFYSIMLLLLLAVGAVVAASLFGLSLDLLAPGNAPGDFSWWALYPAYILFTVGVAFAFQMRRSDIPLAVLVTLIVTAVAQAGAYLFGGFTGTFLASVAMVALSRYLARSPNRSPAYVFIITPFFTLTPGSHGLRAFESVIGGDPITGIQDFGTLFANLVVIALGMIAGMLLTYKWRSRW